MLRPSSLGGKAASGRYAADADQGTERAGRNGGPHHQADVIAEGGEVRVEFRITPQQPMAQQRTQRGAACDRGGCRQGKAQHQLGDEGACENAPGQTGAAEKQDG